MILYEFLKKHLQETSGLCSFQGISGWATSFRLGLTLQGALGEVDWFFTNIANMGCVKFVRKYFFFRAAGGAFAGKRF